MTTAPHPTSARRGLRRIGALGTTLAVTLLVAALPAAAAPATPGITGQACLPGQGVTVVVDFTSAAQAYGGDLTGPVRIGCALGEQDTLAKAGAAAGFTFTSAGGFLDAIDGVPAGTPVAPATANYWAVYLSTTNHEPTGPAATEWQYSKVGTTGGPAAAGTTVLFQIEHYPGDPRGFNLALADIPGHQPGSGTVTVPTYPAATGSARAAATWLGGQLKAAGYAFPGSFGWGQTADTLIGMAAAGVGKDVIGAAANKLYHSGQAYIGSPAQIGSKWPAIAKAALALQVAGLDPTAFPDGGGTRNLIDELRLAQNPDGSFGTSGTDVPFSHAIALYALERTEGGAPAAAVTWLKDQQCTTAGSAKGSYGFGPCGADLDSTALVVQALLGAGVPASDPSVANADRWMVSVQQPDGALPGYGNAPNTNSTGLGGQALLASGSAYAGAVGKAAGYIGSLQVTCSAITPGGFTTANLGAIAYGGDDFTAGSQDGIGPNDLDPWIRATSQALLGLGLPAVPRITAAGAIPLPPAAACPTITLGASSVAAGGTVTVTVTGAPATETLTVTVQSDPVTLGELHTDAAGHAVGTFTVPAATAPGAHHIALRGDGVDLQAAVTITAAATSTATASHDQTSGAGSELAATGPSPATGPMALVALLALLVGAVMVFAVREPRVLRGRHRA